MKMNKLNAKYQEIFRNRLIENGINVDNIWEIIKNEQLGTYNKLLNEIIELGIANPSQQYLSDIKERISPEDLATLIYTSGTTGNPKGVMLTHSNLLNNVKAVTPIVPMYENSRVLSYLPLCHIYERMMIYVWHYLGISIYYAESMATIADNLNEVKPDIFTTVPRLLEKFYDKIIAVGRKQKGIKKRIFFWANEVANDFELDSKSWLYRQKLKIARKLVLKKWKAALGGRLNVVVSGGAAIQPRLSRIFWAMDIRVLEGYGLTETSPVIGVSNFFKNGVKFGTVGPVLPGIEVKIAEDGEILTRGHCLMQGYYKASDLTKEAIDEDGWFHTGDIGTWVDEKFLKITDRKKEIFKTSSGTIRYYHSFSNSLQITNDYDSSYTRSTARGDLWKNYHIDMRNISKEGGVIFKNSKKPERLIYDLLYAFTNPGDIVLDSFLGSGTTIAVAHKMNRKWIGIEIGEHQMFQLAKPRIDRIIDNKDQTGVTNRTNWNGGGAYRFYEVASSLVKFDEFEQPIINSDYNADMLAAAIALHEGYKYNPSQEVFWKQAHSSENSFLFVTTNHVNHQYLDSIYNQLEENEFLLISCKSFDSNIDKKYKNISIKKIPDSILKNCEFEKDNYNLNIINPPSYEEEDDYYE